MNLDSVRINSLTVDGWEWYRGYLEVLDAYDLDRYLALLADDVTVQFNNDDPLVGKAAAGEGLGQFWGSIQKMGLELVHEPLNIYGSDENLVMEALNHYVDADGERRTVRATAWTDRGADGLVTSVRLFQDMTPVFS